MTLMQCKVCDVRCGTRLCWECEEVLEQIEEAHKRHARLRVINPVELETRLSLYERLAEAKMPLTYDPTVTDAPATDRCDEPRDGRAIDDHHDAGR